MSDSDLEREIGELQAKLTALRRERYGNDRAQRRQKVEQSPRIQTIKKLYVAGEISIAAIAERANTSPGAITALVRKYGWPLRSPAQAAAQRKRRVDEGKTSGGRPSQGRVAELHDSTVKGTIIEIEAVTA